MNGFFQINAKLNLANLILFLNVNIRKGYIYKLFFNMLAV